MATIKINNIELSHSETAIVMALIKSVRRQATNTLSYNHKHNAEDRFQATVALNDDQIDRLTQIIKYTL